MNEGFDSPLPGLRVAPRVHPTAFVAPGAVVIGDVEIGELASIWYGAVLRGDSDRIRIGARTNIQDGTVVHVDEGVPTVVEEEVTVGHGVVLHGCTVRRRCLIGIGSRVLNHAEIGEGSLVAAGTLVPEKMIVPPGSLVVGVPGRVRELPDRLRQYMDGNWKHYVSFGQQYRARGLHDVSGTAAPGSRESR
ncbi:MAG: gamma carbonic anhydrase family protein [Candidatus Eisenbacteria bacterium]|nr:gamma carbonic anhydrase family protein [Candidatus Eisenbacteria bacterium]